MKTFWKITLILWGITFSIECPEKRIIPKSCGSCIGMSLETKQASGAYEADKFKSIT